MAEELINRRAAWETFCAGVREAGGVCAYARAKRVSLASVSEAYNDMDKLRPTLLASAGIIKVERFMIVRRTKQEAPAHV